MNQYTYYAFISYAHKDEKHAAWLQKRLENYRIPVKLRKTHGEALPKQVRPVFRDKTDLRPGNLEKSLASELDDSRYLIVLCSPAASHSSWVNREIEHFRQSGGEDRLIPVIVDCPKGAPVSSCYPDALTRCDTDQLGISIAEFGKTKTVLHVLSRLLDLRFDSLYERHKKARNRKSVLLALLSLLLLFVLSIPPRAFFEISQQQEALTSTVAVTDHIASSLETSGSPLVEERLTSLNATWVPQASDNNVTWPIARRRENSKIFTGELRRELASAFATEHLLPGGKEAFREQLNLLNNQNEQQAQSVIGSAESVIRNKKSALEELKEIDESRSLADAKRHLGYLESNLIAMRLHSIILFWELHDLLQPLANDGHPEASQALALSASIPFDKPTALDKLQESLDRKKLLVNNAESEVTTKKQHLADAYDRIRAKCTPAPNDPPELVWGKMVRLLTLGLVNPEALSNLDHYERMMKANGNDPAAYTVPARLFIRNFLHKTHEGGIVVFGFEHNHAHSSLKTGDIITAINGHTIRFAADYIEERKRSKDKAPVLTILRYNKQSNALQKRTLSPAPGDPRIGMLDLLEEL